MYNRVLAGNATAWESLAIVAVFPEAVASGRIAAGATLSASLLAVLMLVVTFFVFVRNDFQGVVQK
ncbi:MAG TPA: hypothetical protein VF618_09150 [Thermoanaerobaculia bacterium]